MLNFSQIDKELKKLIPIICTHVEHHERQPFLKSYTLYMNLYTI